MVREIISLHVGQAGNQCGAQVVNGHAVEHDLNCAPGGKFRYRCVRKDNNKIDLAATKASPDFDLDDADGDGIPDVLEEINVFFHNKLEAESDKNYRYNTLWVPRTVVVDLEPGVVDSLSSTHPAFQKICENNNLISTGTNGAGNNWAKGHYTEGAELVDGVMEIVKSEAEKCDVFQGFQLFHSIGGGTGSGFGTLILLKIRDQYPDKITCSYSVYPSPKVSDTVVEPYNAVLSSHQLLENSDETFVLDNEAMMNILHNVFKQDKSNFEVMNKIIAAGVSGVTCPLRFQGTINSDLRKLGTNLVPFPRLHFFNISEYPLNEGMKSDGTVKDVASKVTDESYTFVNVKYKDGKILAMNVTFRNRNFDQKKAEEQMKIKQKKFDNDDQVVTWISNNFKLGQCTVPRRSSDPAKAHKKAHEISCSATGITNTTALKGIFQRLATQFGALFKRKAFLHWYKGEGMDEMEFQEGDKNVRDLITEYQDKQDATYEEESAGEDDEHDNSDI